MESASGIAPISVCHIITGLGDGGAEAVLFRLCTSGSAAKHHVISMMNNGKYGPLLRQAGVKVTCLNMSHGRVTLAGLWQLWRILRRERPIVVQCWMYHANLVGGIIGRLAGIRAVFWGIHHTMLDPQHTKSSTIAVAKLCARVSAWLPQVIVCCAQKSLEVHRGMGYAPDKLAVIANGYDLARFSVDDEARARLRAEWSVGDRCLLGTVGRFDPLKDHHNLLRALAELKQRGQSFYCVLVGRGMDGKNAQLNEWITELGLQADIRLLGQRSDIPDVMNALDMHVLSSCSEAFPNVIAEAMACGTPAVTTDVGDAAIMVGSTGWVAPPQDATALADALSAACDVQEDAPAWAARRAAARQRVEENFSLSRMVASYGELWAGKTVELSM